MNDPVLQFDPARHEYSINGKVLPNVTGITRPLSNGFDGIPPAVLEFARERGQAVHKAVQFHNENDLDIASLDTTIVPYFEGWLKFLSDTGFKVLGSEQPMYSLPYQYAGTADLWGEITGDLWLPDIKCTAVIPPWTAIQTSGYQRLLSEHIGRKARRGALQLKKDGTYRFDPYTPADDAKDFSIFNACLSIFNWRQHNNVNNA